MRLDFSREISLGSSAHMSVDNLSVLEENEGRNASDAIVHRNIVTLIHIALADDGLVCIFVCKLLDDWCYGLAWSAPCCPEINYYEFVCIKGFCEIRISNYMCHNIIVLVVKALARLTKPAKA